VSGKGVSKSRIQSLLLGERGLEVRSRFPRLVLVGLAGRFCGGLGVERSLGVLGADAIAARLVALVSSPGNKTDDHQRRNEVSNHASNASRARPR